MTAQWDATAKRRHAETWRSLRTGKPGPRRDAPVTNRPQPRVGESMGRARKSGKRTKGGRLSRAVSALLERNPPNERILERRALFAFVRKPAAKRQDGRDGEIDSEVCDGIGQLCALGLLDNHGFDPVELRDRGRLYAELYWHRYTATAPITGSVERSDRSTGGYDGVTARDRLFEKMDGALDGQVERAAVMSLVVDPMWGDDIVPWAQALIAEALLKRKCIPNEMVFPTLNDREMLNACVRGLCAIVDGALPQRRAA